MGLYTWGVSIGVRGRRGTVTEHRFGGIRGV